MTASGTFLFPKSVRAEESITEPGHLISRSSFYKKVKIFRKTLKLNLSTVTNFDNKLKVIQKKMLSPYSPTDVLKSNIQNRRGIKETSNKGKQ